MVLNRIRTVSPGEKPEPLTWSCVPGGPEPIESTSVGVAIAVTSKGSRADARLDSPVAVMSNWPMNCQSDGMVTSPPLKEPWSSVLTSSSSSVRKKIFTVS